MAELLAEAPGGELWRELGVERREDPDLHLPPLARLELDAIADGGVARVAELRQDDLRLDGGVLRVLEQELAAVALEAPADERRQRRRAKRVAEREVVGLDGEDVREVARELEPELERDRLHALVLDHDHVLHPLADEAPPLDREDVLAEAARERVPRVERGREVLDLPRGEQERPRAVDRQHEPGEEARVGGEEAAPVA